MSTEPKVLFLADQFADVSRDEKRDYPGGAELTDEAAMEASPWPIDTAKATEVDPKTLRDYDLHIIGNLETAPSGLVDALSSTGRHILFEHDVRICRWRGNFPVAASLSHRYLKRCNCHRSDVRKLFDSSLGAIFLTHRQLHIYRQNPYFNAPRTAVLGSSLMNRDFLERADADHDGERPHDAAILDSSSDIKGTESARSFCHEHGVEPVEISGMTPNEVLDTLEKTKTFVYLPEALEPAGRMLLEARFLGCNIVANEHTGVVGESWWGLDDDLAYDVLEDAPSRFWRIVQRFRKHPPHNSSNANSFVPAAVSDAVSYVASLNQARLRLGDVVANRLTERLRDMEKPRLVQGKGLGWN